MKVDLCKLNNYNHIPINEKLIFPKEMLEGMDIRSINDAEATGEILIDEEDNIILDLEVKGTFILPCAVTLEDVSYDFSVNFSENLGNFNDFYNNKQKSLEILPFIWENIVSEVPIRVVKEGVKNINTHGNGWELVSEDDH